MDLCILNDLNQFAIAAAAEGDSSSFEEDGQIALQLAMDLDSISLADDMLPFFEETFKKPEAIPYSQPLVMQSTLSMPWPQQKSSSPEIRERNRRKPVKFDVVQQSRPLSLYSVRSVAPSAPKPTTDAIPTTSRQKIYPNMSTGHIGSTALLHRLTRTITRTFSTQKPKSRFQDEKKEIKFGDERTRYIDLMDTLNMKKVDPLQEWVSRSAMKNMLEPEEPQPRRSHGMFDNNAATILFYLLTR